MPQTPFFPRPIPRRAALASAAVLVAGAAAPIALADLQQTISSKEGTAGSLRSAIAAETARIRSTSGGLAAANRRLAGIQAELNRRETTLMGVEGQLMAARDHLTRLENRLQESTNALRGNLVAQYENSPPDVVSVIVESHGFDDLLNRLDDLRRTAAYDAHVVGDTRTARREVAAQAASLGTLEARDKELANAVLAERQQAAAIQGALLSQRISALRSRAANAARLHGLESQLGHLRAKLFASGFGGGLRVNVGGLVQPPPGAPAAVGEVMAAGNAIATLPYLYGGGHGSFHANAYDCSGSVSYALAAAGLVSSPLTSGEFESWGQPGPGRWITVYANSGHVYMTVAGWRFDTVALSEGGTRWSRSGADAGGYVVRHPPGL